MKLQSALLSGFLLLSACGTSSSAPTDLVSTKTANPIALQQIDRVSLLAWKETLGPAYPLTVSRPDSIARIIALFDSGAQWTEQTTVSGVPMLAAFYRAGTVASQRGFIETSHGMGGLMVVQEGGKLYTRTASAADIARFLSFFGVGTVLIPD